MGQQFEAPTELTNVKTHMTQPHGDDQTPAFLAHLIQVSSFNDALPPPVRCFNLRNAPLPFLSGLYHSYPLNSAYQCLSKQRCCFVPFFPAFPFIAPLYYHLLCFLFHRNCSLGSFTLPPFPLSICVAASASPAYLVCARHRACWLVQMPQGEA